MERGRRQRGEVVKRVRGGRLAPERWMQQAREAGRAGRGRQAVHTCDHSHCDVTWFCLRPSGPQRQSRLSVGRLSTAPGSPTSGLLGVGQFGQGGTRVAGWGKDMGLGKGSGIFPSKNTLPWPLRCGLCNSRNLPSRRLLGRQHGCGRAGGLALGF